MSTTLEYTEKLVQQIVDSGKDHQEWLGRLRETRRRDRDWQFEVGDLLVEGEAKWTHKIYDEAASVLGYPKKTLYIFAHVARSVKILTRVKELSWAHHRAVARFPEEKQAELLGHAQKHGLKLRQFKRHVRIKYPRIIELPADTEAPVEWNDHWRDMPEFVNEDLSPFRSIHVHFESQEHLDQFAELAGQKITSETKYIWYPRQEKQCHADRCYVDADNEGTREVAG